MGPYTVEIQVGTTFEPTIAASGTHALLIGPDGVVLHDGVLSVCESMCSMLNQAFRDGLRSSQAPSPYRRPDAGWSDWSVMSRGNCQAARTFYAHRANKRDRKEETRGDQLTRRQAEALVRELNSAEPLFEAAGVEPSDA